MELARIAELLEPFLGPHRASITSDHSHSSSDHCHSEEQTVSHLCHSEEQSDEEPAFLSTAQLQSISTYIDILLRWNARINLTAIRDPEDIVTRHFGESLFAARHLFPVRDAGPAAKRRQNAAHSLPRASRGGASRGSPPPTEQATEGRKNLASKQADLRSYQGTASSRAESTTGQAGALAPEGAANDRSQPAPSEAKGPTPTAPISLADIGSGAGFPGLPIKLWAPQISLTLIESNHKKATFLREVVRALTLTDINIRNVRADKLLPQKQYQAGGARHFQPPFDVVTLRAVERFPDILPQAATLVAPAGRLTLLIGSAQQAHVLATLPTFHWLPPTPVPLSKSRILLVGTREP
jgi:16S rRNA (guanine(527)-N(7))-methyltransferase RsmG